MVFSFGSGKEARKNFPVSTKKMVWMTTAGYQHDAKFDKNVKSKCSQCHRTLIWGDRTYDFDHFNNNNSDNRPVNCKLVCVICHRKATKVKVVTKSNIWGLPTKKTVLEKVGYKKPQKKSSTSSTVPKPKKAPPNKPATKKKGLFGI